MPQQAWCCAWTAVGQSHRYLDLVGCVCIAEQVGGQYQAVHRAGEKMFIDYAGPTIALIEHGVEVGRANIFVATMAASGYSFALATPRQTAGNRRSY